MTEEKTEVKKLRTMANALEELQLALEPVRDKALDQKAFYTGYSQCAEQMIKVIVARMNHFREQAKLEETGTLVEEPVKVEEKVEEEMESPLIVDAEPKGGRKKRKTQEA
jgi:hypothetical protein